MSLVKNLQPTMHDGLSYMNKLWQIIFGGHPSLPIPCLLHTILFNTGRDACNQPPNQWKVIYLHL